MSVRSRPSADLDAIDVVAPNLNRRLSGVTSTLERVLPAQARTIGIAALGFGLPRSVPHIDWTDLPALRKRPARHPFRIWHARRNIEMLAGVILRDVLRFPLKLVFTSASQRHHKAWTRFLIGRMDAVISTSQKTASYLKRPSVVIGHGIDVELFRPASDRAKARAELGLPDLRFAGCFGRIRRQKGSDVFIEAMLRILPNYPDAGAVLLGRATGGHGDFLDELKQRIAKANLADRILFAGEVSPSAIAAWYRALDVFVAPQRWEGFGVTPLEAMASGVPVIATRVGAFDSLIDGESGVLVPPGDIDQLTAALDRLMGDPALAEKMGRSGRRRAAEKFSISGEAEAINGVYEGVWAGTLGRADI